MAARKIGVVTVGRSDYGILRPILRRLDSDAEVELALIIGGMHLESRFGDTVGEIEDDGFDTSERVGFSVDDDTPHGIARTVGAAVADFADAFARVRPDLVVVLGDRAEMFAAASAAVPLLIPLAHIHGGELSEGAIDDSFRHAMTKMSHLHFVSTEPYAARVRQMGEEDWRVVVSGAPALDNLAAGETASDEELARLVPLDLSRPTLLVTYHPATRAYGTAADAIAELLAALDGADMQVVFTRPNADAENAVISDAIEAFARARPQTACIVDSLGTRGYFALMRCAAAMVGNSSSG
jgi:UDP-hydrolysing UDP-N-acetyl-D-glucosamine 2-epimerase